MNSVKTPRQVIKNMISEGTDEFVTKRLQLQLYIVQV